MAFERFPNHSYEGAAASSGKHDNPRDEARKTPAQTFGDALRVNEKQAWFVHELLVTNEADDKGR